MPASCWIYQDAHDQFAHALRLYSELGDHPGQAHVHHDTAWSYGKQGRYQDALDHGQQALRCPARQATVQRKPTRLTQSAGTAPTSGTTSTLSPSCQQGLDLERVLGNRFQQADAWDSLGYTHDHLGDHAQAVTCYNSALSIYRELGARYYQARTLARLGGTYRLPGNPRPPVTPCSKP